MQSHRPTWQTNWPWLLLFVLLLAAAVVAAYASPPTAGTPRSTPVAYLSPSAGSPVAAKPVEDLPTEVPTATLIPPSPTPSPEPTLTPTSLPSPTTPAESASPAPLPATPTPLPASAAPTPTPAFPSAIVRADILNVRSGPGTVYDRIGQVAAGETLRLTGRNTPGDWWKVELKDGEGWVSDAWVNAAGPLDTVAVLQAPPAPTPAPQPALVAPSVAALPAATGFFDYGIQIDPYGDLGAAIGAVNGLGFRWVKIQVPWKDFEGTQGQRHFPDDVIDRLHGGGIQVLASIVKAPRWARNPAYGFAEEGPPQNPWDYGNFVGAFAGHYCGRVQAIEVWNEQNLYYEWGNEPLDAGRYVQLLAVAYQAIKAACPGMIVVSGAPTPTGATPPLAIRDTTFLEQMYQAGLSSWSDAIGVHPSGYGNPPDVRFQDWQAGNYSRPSHVSDPSFYFRNTMEQYRAIMVKYGDANKRLWPTEFGWASTQSPVRGYEYAAYNSGQQQGEYIVRAYQMMKSWGFVGVAFLWNLNYNVSAPGSELAAFGIMGRSAQGMLQGMSR